MLIDFYRFWLILVDLGVFAKHRSQGGALGVFATHLSQGGALGVLATHPHETPHFYQARLRFWAM